MMQRYEISAIYCYILAFFFLFPAIRVTNMHRMKVRTQAHVFVAGEKLSSYQAELPLHDELS